MGKQVFSRRNFLRAMGAGTATTLLANAGLPAVLAGSQRQFQPLSAATAQLQPQVELLIGDVVGFQLTSNDWTAAFGSVTFQLHKAWYNGDDVYYIRTDTSDQTFAQENFLVHVPLLNAALVAEGSTSQLYTFTNGADEQFPVVSTTPENENYSPAWQVHTVTFSGSPSLLTSADDILAAAEAGDVTVEAQNLIVNFPLVKWPGGELPEDTAKDSYLGTGPLIAPVDTDNLLVTFKLHECYPGSRYIVTDTSAVPMAPMMNIAPAGPTQKLADVGAVDEIWVWGNGIPGSGVMGFQPAIFDHAAGNPVWSPFWHHFTAVWNDDSAATVVRSSEELRALEAAGDITVFKGVPDMDQAMPAFVVNCPVPLKAANTFDPAAYA